MTHKIVIRLSEEQYRLAQSLYSRWNDRYASGIPDLLPFNIFCELALVATLEEMYEKFLTNSKSMEEMKNEDYSNW